MGLELELHAPAVEGVLLVREEVDERLGVGRAVEGERDGDGLAAQLMDRQDRRAVPIAAVRKDRRRARIEDLERAEADLRALAPPPDEPLEPVQQRPVLPPL